MDKVSVIGSGNVGANTAFFIAEKGITDVCLFDILDGLAMGKALDMMEAAPLRKYRNRITGISDIGGIANSESVVIAAGMACSLQGKREDLLEENWRTLKGILEQVIALAPGCVIIVATEPVDLLTTLAAREFALPRGRLLGLGCVLDGARFKSTIAAELSLSAENVSAMVIGRHSDDMVVLPEYTRVSGIPLSQLLPESKIRELAEDLRTAGGLMAELAECPGTYYTPSAAAAEVVDSIHMDLKRILSVSVELKGEYGISGVALSLPCVIGKKGVEKVFAPLLSDAGHEALKNSGIAINKIIAGKKL